MEVKKLQTFQKETTIAVICNICGQRFEGPYSDKIVCSAMIDLTSTSYCTIDICNECAGKFIDALKVQPEEIFC
jgi:hypothetical protein